MLRRVSKRVVFCLLLSLCAPASAQWKVDRPIRIIVPWAAGGSTDQVTRVTAVELEKALGQPVTVINQPGASGAIGTQNVLNAPHDGYTFAAGAVKDLGSYKLLGMADTTINDWRLYLNVAHVSVVSVKADLPYRSMEELLAALRARPGEIRVATAGVNSSGHAAMQAIARAAKVEMKQLTYDGGRPAVLAVLTGEADITTQLAAEQVNYIKAGRLRPLAVVSDMPLQLAGYGRIEPVSKAIPGFKDPANYFGIFVPRDIPPAMLKALDRVWAEKIVHSRDLQDYAQGHGARFDPLYGEKAVEESMPALRAYSWAQHAAGRTKMSPAAIGILPP